MLKSLHISNIKKFMLKKAKEILGYSLCRLPILNHITLWKIYFFGKIILLILSFGIKTM